MRVRSERGFTLPEMIAVTTVTIVLLAVGIGLLHPVSYATANQDAERQLHIAALAQAFGRYKAKNAAFPDKLPTESMPIGSQLGDFDLCTVLVPEFIKELPMDPTKAASYQGDSQQSTTDQTPCAHRPNIDYNTGYTFRHNEDGSITVSAEAADGGVLTAATH